MQWAVREIPPTLDSIVRESSVLNNWRTLAADGQSGVSHEAKMLELILLEPEVGDEVLADEAAFDLLRRGLHVSSSDTYALHLIMMIATFRRVVFLPEVIDAASALTNDDLQNSRKLFVERTRHRMMNQLSEQDDTNQ